MDQIEDKSVDNENEKPQGNQGEWKSQENQNRTKYGIENTQKKRGDYEGQRAFGFHPGRHELYHQEYRRGRN